MEGRKLILVGLGEDKEEGVEAAGPGAPLSVELSELHPDAVAEEGAIGEAAEGGPERVRQEFFHKAEGSPSVGHQDGEDHHGETRDEDGTMDQKVDHVAEFIHIVW